MKLLTPLIAVFSLVLIAYLGVDSAGMTYLFGIVIPYLAITVFLLGFIYKVYYWARSPVPFNIPTTTGQGKSLPSFKADRIGSPQNRWDVVKRMALEVLFFSALFGNIKADLTPEGDLKYSRTRWLWAGSLLFHWSFLIILLRHYRFFLKAVPGFTHFLESVDGLGTFLLPTFYVTDATILIGITFLFFRRVVLPQLNYISQKADFFPLLLIFSIATTGILMRYVMRVNIVDVKVLIRGLIIFQPQIPDNIGWIFYAHLFLISILAIYFPFSKLMHSGGVFFSPTRNLVNNSREVRHINPWNKEQKFRTYVEYEDEFRDKMRNVELPLDKE
jgi:nitrate reductase gamma subunit